MGKLKIVIFAIVFIFGSVLPNATQAAEVGLVKTLYFKSNKYYLNAKLQNEIKSLKPILKNVSAIRVDGYVQKAKDPTKPSLIKSLSKKRAVRVANYLGKYVERWGYKIIITAKGKGQPSEGNTLATARRAEIHVTALNE